MAKKTVAVIGYGYVGKAVEQFFKPAFDTVIYDPPLGFSDQAAVNAADIAIVCVPTPMSDDGQADISLVESTFAWLTTPVVTIKSTVPPGTTKKLIEKYGMEDKLCFTPEFLGEGNYPVPHWEGMPHPTDMKLHSFHLFGGSKVATGKAIEFWKKAAGPFAEFVQTDPTTAELTKYTVNAWIATKITFVNEFYDLAKAFGVDFNELRELWLLDGRVGRSHTLVFEDKRGFDGKCIPKDTNAIAKAAEVAGYDPKFIRSVLESNRRFRGE